MFFALDAPIKDYSWGSSDEISAFRGREASANPEAEQWFGDHPQSETRIEVAGDQQGFVDWLRQNNSDFPLLIKLLSAAQPLSIQAHPSAAQAAAGFAAEEASGLDDQLRTYRDSSAKPELLIALSSGFRALVGFVEPEIIDQRLELWRNAGLDAPTVDILRTNLLAPSSQSVPWILEGGQQVEQCIEHIGVWVSDEAPRVRARGEMGEELELLTELCSFYPSDAGVLFAALMHHIVLERGEALFVDAGIVHAYLRGFGLEVMLPSDNVVRAGLTVKPRNASEFMKVAKLVADASPPVIRPTERDGVRFYKGFGSDFSVTQVLDSSCISLKGAPAIAVVESGTGVISGKVSGQTVTPGDVMFVSADEVELKTAGTVSVWVVHAAH